MSDDSIVYVDTASPGATDSEDDWALPPYDQIAKMRPEELRNRIRNLIELVRRTGRGEANPKGGMPLVFMSAQYLTEELARRNQDRQTETMISQTETVKKYTGWITGMTLVMMVAALWDHLPAWSTVMIVVIAGIALWDLLHASHVPTAPAPPPAAGPS